MRLLIVFASIMATFYGCVVDQQATTVSVPHSWKRLPAPPTPNSTDWPCPVLAPKFWTVAVVDNQLTATASSRQRRRDPLPYEVDFSRAIGPGDPPSQSSWTLSYAREQAARQVVRVEDGWLVGFDAGENLGSLWWYPTEPGPGVRLWNLNVLAIVAGPEPHVWLVLSGLDHDVTNRGVALWIARDADHRWAVETQQSLLGEPSAFAQTSTDVIVATAIGLQAIRPTRRVDTLLRTAPMSRAHSVAVAPSGDIAVGRTLFVTVYRRNGAGYTEESYVPGDCTEF